MEKFRSSNSCYDNIVTQNKQRNQIILRFLYRIFEIRTRGLIICVGQGLGVNQLNSAVVDKNKFVDRCFTTPTHNYFDTVQVGTLTEQEKLTYLKVRTFVRLKPGGEKPKYSLMRQSGTYVFLYSEDENI